MEISENSIKLEIKYFNNKINKEKNRNGKLIKIKEIML
jgi:hypothetical protein